MFTRAVRASPYETSGLVISVEHFGARSESGRDDTAAVQAAISAVERVGGGTVLIPGRYRCGNLVVSGNRVKLLGQNGWLVDACLTIRPEATNVEVADLGLVDTRGDGRSYLMDISGTDCSFTSVHLTKSPAAGGYQMYVRQEASRCRFEGLRLEGSNGIFVSGTDHLFRDFDFTNGAGGDDAFAIKALGEATRNITIRSGIVRGYSAIVSFGSEIGIPDGRGGGVGSVRNVLVEDVVADRCGSVAFFKPGALGSDWNDGVVENIHLRNLTLRDPTGTHFQSGIWMLAGRGATIRNVEARGIHIFARAKNRGVMRTSAVNMAIVDVGAPARMDGVDLQVKFVDPYAGAPHGPHAPGYPIDHVVHIEKRNPAKGTMSRIVLDVEGTGSSFGGIAIGPRLDGAVRINRAILKRVATDPQATLGGGGIWSASRVSLGDLSIDSVKLPRFAGPAFARPR